MLTKLNEWVVTKGTKTAAKNAFKTGYDLGSDLASCGGCRRACGSAGLFIDTEWCVQMAAKSSSYDTCTCLSYQGYPKGKTGAAAQPRPITPKDLGMAA